MNQIEDYEIGLNTVAIVPLDENTSRVYEDEDEYIVKKSANSIIKSLSSQNDDYLWKRYFNFTRFYFNRQR